MHRFFLPQDSFSGSTVIIPPKLVHQLRNVLRLSPGDCIVALDNGGWEYEVELRRAARGGLEGAVLSRAPATGEPGTRITLYQALLKGTKFELVLQKCTEIGVAAFAPIVCERCVAGEPTASRAGRWQKIIAEAAEQSGRGRLPALRNVESFREACEGATGTSLLPWEGERSAAIRSRLKKTGRTDDGAQVNIFIGPEGGFTVEEVKFAEGCGIVPVSLGRRILRAETAGLVAASVVLYEFGDMDCAGRGPGSHKRPKPATEK